MLPLLYVPGRKVTGREKFSVQTTCKFRDCHGSVTQIDGSATKMIGSVTMDAGDISRE